MNFQVAMIAVLMTVSQVAAIVVPIEKTQVNGIYTDLRLESVNLEVVFGMTPLPVQLNMDLPVSVAPFAISPAANLPAQFMTQIVQQIATDLVTQVLQDANRGSGWQGCGGWLEVQPTSGRIATIQVNLPVIQTNIMESLQVPSEIEQYMPRNQLSWDVEPMTISSVDFTIPAFKITNQVSCGQNAARRVSNEEKQSSDTKMEDTTEKAEPRNLVSHEVEFRGDTVARVSGLQITSAGYTWVDSEGNKGNVREIQIDDIQDFQVTMPEFSMWVRNPVVVGGLPLDKYLEALWNAGVNCITSPNQCAQDAVDVIVDCASDPLGCGEDAINFIGGLFRRMQSVSMIEIPNRIFLQAGESRVDFESRGAPGAIEIQMLPEDQSPDGAFFVDNIVIPNFSIDLPKFNVVLRSAESIPNPLII